MAGVTRTITVITVLTPVGTDLIIMDHTGVDTIMVITMDIMVGIMVIILLITVHTGIITITGTPTGIMSLMVK